MTLPAGTRVRVGHEVWRHEQGAVLVGGTPLRLLRLSDRAAAYLLDDVVTVSDAQSTALADRLVAAGVAHPDPESLPAVPASDLTVVIPTHGRDAEVDALLAGLAGLRVIVVDDATPHPASARLRAVVDRHGQMLLRLPRNVGPASARNAGLARVTTPLVAFVDSDVVTTADDLLVLARQFADPGLALAAPRVVGVAEERMSWVTRYENARASVDLGGRPALVRPRSRVSWLSSTCLIARRAALGDGFTPGMRVAEDVDLVWRLAETPWRVRYEPRTLVHHRHRAGVGAWLARKAFYGTGAAALAPRHPQSIPPAILRPWALGVLVALLAGRRWSIPVAAAIALGETWRLRRRTRRVSASWLLPLRLVGAGVVSALTQASALALRHWWPVAAVAGVLSRRARGIVAVMAVVDAFIEHRRVHADLDLARFTLARRLDDVAYGAGVWYGCLRRGSLAALRPDLRPDPNR